MVESTLQHIIYGTVIIDKQATDSTTVLALSDTLNAEEANRLIHKIPLTPFAVNDIAKSQSIAYVNLTIEDNKQYGLLRAHFQTDKQSLPIRQLIFLPNEVMKQSYTLDKLLDLIPEPLPNYPVSYAPLEPLMLQASSPQSVDKMVTIIKSLLDDVAKGNFSLLLAILDLALQKNVIISNFPKNNAQRLALIQVLRLLIPVVSRKLLTFTTNTASLDYSLPIVTFSESDQDTQALRFDWQNPHLVEFYHPYTQQLSLSWDDDVIALVNLIKRFDEIANALSITDQSTLSSILTGVASRQENDERAIRGEEIPLDNILLALNSPVPMSLELQTAYMILLLENNFKNRDTQTAKIIADELDENITLDNSLTSFFNTSIEEQPDAVYAFVRKHLNNASDTVDEKWLKRLHDSAKASVDIALQSKSAETIRSWLNLIAREPLRYELSDILHEGILSAQAFTANSPELAKALLTLAVKRQPDLIDTLLENPDLLGALSETEKLAILESDASAIEAISEESRELFLLALHRSIESKRDSVTSAGARALWQIHTQQKTNTLPPQFRPLLLIQQLAESPEQFVNGAVGTLLTLILADGTQDTLFHELIPSLNTQDQFSDTLSQALEQSTRSNDDILQILSTLLANEAVEAQTVVDSLSNILNNRNWDEESLALIEQLSRVMTQYPDTQASTTVLWHLAERSAIYKNEQMLKVALRRLLDSFNDAATEDIIVDNIQRLRKESQWSANGRVTLIKWWRAYAREQGTGQLQKIDKSLDGKRSLEDLRAIVQTSIAMRRIIGNRSLEEFSEDVATTYTLLQALSEGFDPNDKLVDSTTIRNEIDARNDELPVKLRPVLSTNLKELAQIITTLFENRSKPSLIRSDDSIERQLLKGEQEPQSALDVMRWLSGYLEGVQKEDNSAD
ncbi:MAG: hypothetical protein Phog2KO_22890 [Phototrophicaceae bacterium]